MSRFDKRRHPRFEGVELEAQLKVDGGHVSGAVIENVSLGGALIGLAAPCRPGKNVLLELCRSGGVTLRLVGRVIAALPKTRGRKRAGVRICFNPASATCTAQLYAMIHGLPGDETFAAAPTNPEAFEFHSIALAEPELELEIDVVEDLSEEVIIDLKDVVEDAPTVVVAALEQELQTRASRIEQLERQLALVRRNARTLVELLVPAALAS